MGPEVEVEVDITEEEEVQKTVEEAAARPFLFQPTIQTATSS